MAILPSHQQPRTRVERFFISSHDARTHELCSRENETLVSLCLNSWLVLLSDSPLDKDNRGKPSRVFQKFRKFLVSRKILDSIIFFSSLADKLVSQTLITKHGTSTGPWLPDMKFTPIFKEYHVWYKTRDSELFRYIITFLYFGKKLDYADESLNSTAFRKWEAVEERLTNLVIPSISKHLHDIFEQMMPSLPIDFFFPSNGNGAVAEQGVKGTIKKIKSFDYDPKIERVFLGKAFKPSEEVGFSSSVLLMKTGVRARNISRLMFVPKNVKTARSICMEPAVYMYVQQAVRRWYEQGIENSLFGNFIDIRDQTRNQLAAEYGSYTSRVDTIDLAAASDSVSMDLIKAIVPRDILYYLIGSRTSRVETPDGSVRELKKFAPMGSALCFPVQCTVYTVIILYAYLLVHYGVDGLELPSDVTIDIKQFIEKHVNRKHGLSPSKFEIPCVYGDDLAVDFRTTGKVVELLQLLGFEVNSEKSFVSNQAYRESCGKHYWDGADVTPVLFRVKRFEESMGAEAYASYISGINNFGDAGFLKLRSYLIWYLRSNSKLLGGYSFRDVMFTSDRNFPGIYTTREVVTQDGRQRFNKDYHREEKLAITVEVGSRVAPKASDLEGLYLYYYTQWFKASLKRRPLDITSGMSLDDAFGARLRRRWMPLR